MNQCAALLGIVTLVLIGCLDAHAGERGPVIKKGEKRRSVSRSDRGPRRRVTKGSRFLPKLEQRGPNDAALEWWACEQGDVNRFSEVMLWVATGLNTLSAVIVAGSSVAPEASIPLALSAIITGLLAGQNHQAANAAGRVCNNRDREYVRVRYR